MDKALIRKLIKSMSVVDSGYKNVQIFRYKCNPIPWSPGYNEYKWQIIEQLLDTNELPNIPFGWGIDERIIEYPWALNCLPKRGALIWDAGSALNFPQILNRLKQNKIYITTLYPEVNFQNQDGISYLYEDLRNVSFKSELFDYVVSISTIEHIGFSNEQYQTIPSKNDREEGGYIEALLEFKRVLKPGGTLLLTVPFGKHQTADSFQVFNADMIRDLIKRLNPRAYTISVYKYCQQGWIRSDIDSCDDVAYCFLKDIPSPDGAAAARGIILLRIIK